MQSGVFIMQTKSRNPVLTINFENAMFIHPNLDLVNEPARPLLFTKSYIVKYEEGSWSLFTKSRYLQNRGLLNQGSGVLGTYSVHKHKYIVCLSCLFF